MQQREIGRRELLAGAVGVAATALRPWSTSAQGSKTRLILLGTGEDTRPRELSAAWRK